MGTPSLTVFKNEDGQEVAAMSRHYDGYLEGHGRQLAEFLKGIRVGDVPHSKRYADGMGCLAARVVAHFKSQSENACGNIYLVPAEPRGAFFDPGHIYTIEAEEKVGAEPTIEVHGHFGPAFKGTAKQMLKWIELIKQGFIDKDHAVLRVAPPYPAIDFDAKYPYLRSVEDQLGSQIRRGTQMAKSIQELSKKYGGDPNQGTAVIACIGNQDNLQKRIQQSYRFVAAPLNNQINKIVFWAAKWDDLAWEAIYKDFFKPYINVTLKLVGEDPIDPSIRAGHHMFDKFIQPHLDGDGCEVP